MTAPMNGWSQQDQRVSNKVRSGQLFRDQHGRLWHAEVEKSTGAPCGPYQPHEAPRPLPWIPDSHYFVFLPHQGDGEPRNHQLEIDYTRIATEWTAAWQSKRELIASEKQRNPNWTDQMILNRIGEMRSPRIPLEAAKGNAFLLGLRPFDPENAGDVWLQERLRPKGLAIDTLLDDGFPGAGRPAVTQAVDAADEVLPKAKRGRPKKATAEVGADAGL